MFVHHLHLVSKETHVNHLFTCLTDDALDYYPCFNDHSQGSIFTFIKSQCKTVASAGRNSTCLEGDWVVKIPTIATEHIRALGPTFITRLT